MNKTYKWISVIGAAVLLSGVLPHTADASASANGQQGDDKPIYENTNHGYNHHHMSKFLQQCLEKWGIQWDQDSSDHQNDQEQAEQEDNNEAPDVNQPTPPQQQQPDTEQPKEENDNQAETGDLNQFEQQVVELTNQERAKQGLSELKIDNELSKVAKEKSRDMQVKNYFDHNSPTYGSPFDMMQQYGIDYRSAGENIAKGQRSPEEVVNAWMNSEGHRANILNSSFTHIGVGFIEQGNIWTQQFIGK